MKIRKTHQKNWEEISDFFSLDCKPPNLRVYKHQEMVTEEFNSDVAKFVGISKNAISTRMYPQIYFLPIKEISALNYRLFITDYNLVVIGGVGLSESFLKNEWEARIVDKKELIHSALSFLHPFYSMHVDPVVTDPSRSLYKAFEEDVAWTFLKQMEGENDKITDFRHKITKDETVHISMEMMEKIMKKTDSVRNPVEAFKRSSKEFWMMDKLPIEIDIDTDYENFLKANYRYARRLEDGWEYFKPKYN